MESMPAYGDNLRLGPISRTSEPRRTRQPHAPRLIVLHLEDLIRNLLVRMFPAETDHVSETTTKTGLRKFEDSQATAYSQAAIGAGAAELFRQPPCILRAAAIEHHPPLQRPNRLPHRLLPHTKNLHSQLLDLFQHPRLPNGGVGALLCHGKELANAFADEAALRVFPAGMCSCADGKEGDLDF